jgi:ribosomal protein S18 acetylase RimI-like enzyme
LDSQRRHHNRWIHCADDRFQLYIETDFRRRGFGTQAVAFLEKKAREMGVNAVHLEVDRGNDSAFQLYRRAGYHDHDRFLMTKWLNR